VDFFGSKTGEKEKELLQKYIWTLVITKIVCVALLMCVKGEKKI